MVTVTVCTDTTSALDPYLFTFKPKINEKSNKITQNLLSDFHQRQIKHVQRLKEIKNEAAIDYRKWYCNIEKSQISHRLPRININNNKMKSNLESTLSETSSSSKNELDRKELSCRKEAHQSSAHLSQLIRAYRPSLKSKTRQSTKSLLAVTLPALSVESTNASQLPSVKFTNRMSPAHRSKSPPKVGRTSDSSPKRSVTNDTINTERLKLAKDEAERAMKDHKIFTIIGPYPALRESLRRRGWIEKFYRGPSLPSVHGNKKSEKKTRSDDDDDEENNDDDNDDDDMDEHPSYEDEGKVPPWEENDGYYGLLSRLVRTAAPNFIWSVRTYDTNALNKDQMVNHFARNGCFTTKVGLCNSLRNLQWFHSGCADEFYPRCYKLSHEDDKIAFIDDYRLTACVSFLKLIQNRCKGVIEPDMSSILAMSSDSPSDTKTPLEIIEEEPQLTRSLTMPLGQLQSKSVNGKNVSSKRVPSSSIEFAVNKVREYVLARDHEDIDISPNTQIDTTDEQWAHFIEHFYSASHSNADIEGMEMYLSKIEECLKNTEQHCPQYHIDGTRNIWILKPGAKSRGRGIVVYDRLEDILKLCSSTLTKDGKFVVQKYIERPLLIHNTKFDIRQWFLVTDWNPLTIWMFKDCYLRFCTEHFSLETRQQSVHLCNYSIQKHYKNNANRHSDLPMENMWTNAEFIEKYLRPNHLADRWDNYIYPAMKDAIRCSMLVAQDTIDARKNSFELFGADFMLGEDLKPWLIEINCSPTMARSTAVTTDMCDGVLEDTCKVMIDRRYNRSADTGRFELIYRGTPVPVPIYIGIDLRVEGKSYKNVRPINNVQQVPSTNNVPSLLPTNATQNLHTTSLITLNSGHTNNTTNPNNIVNSISTPVSMPTQMNSVSRSSSSSTTPAEHRLNFSHPTSAMGTSHNSLSSKVPQHSTSLKLRREMTQPVLSRVEFISSIDNQFDRIQAHEIIPYGIRSINQNSTQNNNMKLNPNITAETKQKPAKTTSNRISAEYLPVRQLSRTRVNDHLPSPKGCCTPSNGVSKINVTDFLYAGKDVKTADQLPIYRPYQRTWLSYKNSPLLFPTPPKTLKRQKTTLDSSLNQNISTLSFPTTITGISTIENTKQRTSSTSPVLVAV